MCIIPQGRLVHCPFCQFLTMAYGTTHPTQLDPWKDIQRLRPDASAQSQSDDDEFADHSFN